MEKIKITRSQQWLMDALLHLMKEKNYRDITVVDIVDKADLGRRTFYRYFKSKDELLLLYCDVIMQQFAEKILEKPEQNLYTVSVSYFEFWEQHLDFLKLLRQSDMLYFVGDRLPEFLVKVALWIKHVEERDVEHVMAEYEYSFYFNMGGYWSITTRWAARENRETPEKMATIITDYIFQ